MVHLPGVTPPGTIRDTAWNTDGLARVVAEGSSKARARSIDGALAAELLTPDK
jgi:hypothetical protein